MQKNLRAILADVSAKSSLPFLVGLLMSGLLCASLLDATVAPSSPPFAISPALSLRPGIALPALERPSLPASPYDLEIALTARQYQVDPLLVKAIIAAESEFNPRCVSPAGARGLMQLMPGTARVLAVKDIFDPQQNIRGGVHHLKYLLARFHNNLPLTLAAYNAGELPVLEHKGIPPYPETQDYVHHVLKLYDTYRNS